VNYGGVIFLHRIVRVWNSLSDSVVSAESVNSFKSGLDKFWSMHDSIYDYRADLLAAGSYITMYSKCRCTGKYC